MFHLPFSAYPLRNLGLEDLLRSGVPTRNTSSSRSTGGSTHKRAKQGKKKARHRRQQAQRNNR